MFQRKPQIVDIPNALVATLADAPAEMLQSLLKNRTAIAEEEFAYAVVSVFCQTIEKGDAPPVALQAYIAEVLPVARARRTAAGNRKIQKAIGRSTVIGRRDYWLSSTVWEVVHSGRSPKPSTRSVCEGVAARWNQVMVKQGFRRVSYKLVERACARYRWLDEYRGELPRYVIDERRGIQWTATHTDPLRLSRRSKKIRVPTACLVNAPNPGERPRDGDFARSLCRGFEIAVEHYGGVTVPGVLPYFAGAFRAVLAGEDLRVVLGVGKDRPGRPERDGAMKDFPRSGNFEDNRDLRLAELVHQYLETPTSDGRKPRREDAYHNASQDWNRENQGHSASPGTARTAWLRWESRVRLSASFRRINAVERQEKENTLRLVASLSQLHPKFWETLLWTTIKVPSTTGKRNIVVKAQLDAIEAEMRHFPAFNLKRMAAALERVGLVRVRSRGAALAIEILDYEARARECGVPTAPWREPNSGEYFWVTADARYPIYKPAGKAP